MIVGLTGNICCGKSTISREFRDSGARVIDADKIAGEYLNIYAEEVGRLFPEAVENGKISKRLVAAEVFSDTKKLARLEELVHPYVFKRINEFANEDPKAVNIAEASLIFEKNAQNRFDKTIVVYSPYEVSRERTKLRGLGDEDFNKRWKLQMPLEEKTKLADFVIDNSVDGKGQVKSVYEKLFIWNQIKDEEIYQEVVKRYSESHRAYHNLTHLFNCLKEFDRVKDKLQNPRDVKTALVFHDIVYDPHEKDNEERSADLAEKFGASRRVRELIMATKHLGGKSGGDGDYVRDIDLSIFGQDEEVFEEYENGIRKEYSGVPDEDFKVGRAEVLKTFLCRRQIFATNFFGDEYERRARKNLIRALTTKYII